MKNENLLKASPPLHPVKGWWIQWPLYCWQAYREQWSSCDLSQVNVGMGSLANRTKLAGSFQARNIHKLSGYAKWNIPPRELLFLNGTRNITTDTASSWLQVEQLYLIHKIHNALVKGRTLLNGNATCVIN